MSGLDVLVVEDEADIRTIVATVLRESGHRVTLAADGPIALAQIRARMFDAALIDVRLPTLDGLTLFRQLRQLAPATDVIIMTGHGNVADAVAALKEGALDYLSKPLEVDELAVRLQRIAERRALMRELAGARAQLARREIGRTLIGSSPAMIQL